MNVVGGAACSTLSALGAEVHDFERPRSFARPNRMARLNADVIICDHLKESS